MFKKNILCIWIKTKSRQQARYALNRSSKVSKFHVQKKVTHHYTIVSDPTIKNLLGQTSADEDVWHEVRLRDRRRPRRWAKKHISCHQTGEAIYIFNRNSDQNTSRNLADEEVLELSKKTHHFCHQVSRRCQLLLQFQSKYEENSCTIRLSSVR